jgi:hypothetical protein
VFLDIFIRYVCLSTVICELLTNCGSSSVGRASAFQADCRGFEPRLPLHPPTPFYERIRVWASEDYENQAKLEHDIAFDKSEDWPSPAPWFDALKIAKQFLACASTLLSTVRPSTRSGRSRMYSKHREQSRTAHHVLSPSTLLRMVRRMVSAIEPQARF